MVNINGDVQRDMCVRALGQANQCKPHARTVTHLKRLLGITAIFVVLLGSTWDQLPSTTPIYLDPRQPIERRVDDLMSRMTLKEKIGQLNLPCVYVDQLGKTIPEKIKACKRFAAGTYTDEIGPGSGFFTLADTILHEGTRQRFCKTKKARMVRCFRGRPSFRRDWPSAALLTCLLWSQFMGLVREKPEQWASMSCRLLY